MNRELIRRAWDLLDSFKQAYPENWHEEDEQVMKGLLEMDVNHRHEHNPWKNVALRVGEELSSVGPDGYYDMHPGVWLNWAMAQNPRGNTSLQRQWVGLTDEEIADAVGDPVDEVYMGDFRKVEAKLKEKNHG